MNTAKPTIYIQSSVLHLIQALVPLLEKNIPTLNISDDQKADYQLSFDDKVISLIQTRSNKNDIFQTPIRIMALIQHIEKIYSQNQNIIIGPYVFNYAARTLTDKAATLHLTEKEAEVLRYLDENRDKGITRNDLLKNVWGYADGVDTHTIETHIYRLRQKIQGDDISDSEILITGDDGYQLVENT